MVWERCCTRERESVLRPSDKPSHIPVSRTHSPPKLSGVMFNSVTIIDLVWCNGNDEFGLNVPGSGMTAVGGAPVSCAPFGRAMVRVAQSIEASSGRLLVR